MALITATSTDKTSFGTLSVDTLFSCHKGQVGLTTDDAPGGVSDYFWLKEGESIELASGLTVKYRAAKIGDTLHSMASGV